MKKGGNEFKVGLLVVLSICILLVILYKTGDIQLKKEGYAIDAVFTFAAGINKNSPVRLAGVEVGSVQDIRLSYDDATNVVLTLWLNKGVKINSGARVYVSTLGLMGEKYIEITPGPKDMPFLEAGSTILGEDPFKMEWFTEKGETLAMDLENTLAEIRKLSANIDSMVVGNRSEVDNIMANLEVTSENIKALSGDLKDNPWKVITKPPDWKDKLKSK